jgi:hypothetical protein
MISPFVTDDEGIEQTSAYKPGESGKAPKSSCEFEGTDARMSCHIEGRAWHA